MKLSDIEIGAGIEITKIEVVKTSSPETVLRLSLDNGLAVTLTLAEVKEPLYGPYYRPLSPEELVQKGDQYFDAILDKWIPACCIGARASDVKYRRRV